MAPNVAYLKGGKCDGTLHKTTADERTYGSIECKGGLYLITTPAKYHNGHRIWKYVGNAINPGSGPDPRAAHLHKGWSDLQHSVNHNLPASLRASRRSLHEGLRSIRRARKVRL